MKIVQELYKENWFDNAPPKNFKPADKRLFETHEKTFIHNIKVYRGRQIILLPEHILFEKFRLWKKELTNHYTDSIIYTAKRIAKALLRKTVRLKGKYILVTDDWSWSYFHWTGDALQRVYLMREQLQDHVVLIPAHFQKFNYVTQSLALFNAKIYYFSADKNYLIEELLLPSPAGSSGVFHYEVINHLASYVQQAALPLANIALQPGKIYISRGKATYRRLLNEELLLQYLKSEGFYILFAEELSYFDQVKVMSGCSLLVSLHGAGLTNILYLPKGANVLEIRHPKDHLNNGYYLLATALQHNYYYLLAETEGEDPHGDDVNINLEEFSKELRNIFNTNPKLKSLCDNESHPYKNNQPSSPTIKR